MEGIDLAGVVDSDFQGIQINFAPPRRICQFSRGGARPAFLRGRAALLTRGGAGLGGAHIPARDTCVSKNVLFLFSVVSIYK